MAFGQRRRVYLLYPDILKLQFLCQSFRQETPIGGCPFCQSQDVRNCLAKIVELIIEISDQAGATMEREPTADRGMLALGEKPNWEIRCHVPR